MTLIYDLDLGHPHLEPDLGPRFRTLIWDSFKDPDLGPQLRTPIWDPDL
jgi:hypothetical protein